MREVVTGLAGHYRYIAAMRLVVDCSRTRFYLVFVQSFYGFLKLHAFIRATLDVRSPTE